MSVRQLIATRLLCKYRGKKGCLSYKELKTFGSTHGLVHLLLTWLVIAVYGTAHAQTWVNVGSAGFSSETATYTSLAINGSGTPYVAYSDQGSGYKATVMKYTGGSWVAVGSAGFSAGYALYTSLAIDGSGMPYVAYEDDGNGYKATVMKYTGGSWVTVGSAGFSAVGVTNTSLAIDGSGMPYVAYQDSANGCKTTVMKYTGSSWVTVGSAGFSTGAARYISLAIDGSGTPYVAYQDTTHGYTATVMKYTGSSWITVGGIGFSAGGAWYTSLAIDGSGTPYVAYQDDAYEEKATVMKYNGSSWVTVGSAGFSDSIAGPPSLAIDGSGTPYVAYNDFANGYKATVMKYNGSSWVTTGSPGFSAGLAGSISLAIAGSGTPYVAYLDAGNEDRATVMKLQVIPPITGTALICGPTGTLSDADTGGVWSSSNTAIATVGSSSGIVSRIGAGTVIITYSDSGVNVTYTITALPVPTAGSIATPSGICVGTPVALSDPTGTPGGVWSSSSGVAAVSGSMVTGVSTGTAIISYNITNACGSAMATKIIIINPAPAAITGATGVCFGLTMVLSDGITGGMWASSNSSVAPVGSVSGVVTGFSIGTSIITYTLPTGCYTSTTEAVNPMPGLVSGYSSVCMGASITLTDPTAGGAWSAGSGAVSVGSGTGIITGVSEGTATISYVLATGCLASYIVTVNPIAAITGTATVCIGATTALADAISGGVWSSADATIATPGSSTGIVTGVYAGATLISYTIPITGCYAVTPVTVSPSPAPVSGVTSICLGAAVTLGDIITGGAWSATGLGVSVGSGTGIVTGVSTGADTITYTLPTGCYNTVDVTIYPNPPAISGPAGLCLGNSATLTDGLPGGTWASSNGAVAPVVTGSGLVSALAAGTTIITYTLPTGCYTTTTLTVVSTITPITGPAGICAGSTVLLGESTGGGVWSSSNVTVALMGASSGVLEGLTAGTANITYSLGGSCRATRVETVYANPAAITGAGSICVGASLTLHDATGGGVWSAGSGSGVASAGSGTGIITGASAGTAVITYTLGSGCSVTTTVTVNGAPTAISGPSGVCVGATITLTDGGGGGGGVWSAGSGSGVVSVGSGTGIVTGVSAGTSIITFSAGTGCVVTKTVTVFTVPAAVTGTTSVCAGATTALHDAVTGGVWSAGSGSGVVSAGSGTGIITGVAQGTAIITYALSSGCAVTTTVTVYGLPAAIGGAHALCAGAAETLTDGTTGGVWSAGSGVVSVGSGTGIITGVTQGTAIITYALSSGCAVTATVAVNAAPAAIAGATAVCIGSTTDLYDATGGGTWSAGSGSGVASVSGTGVVMGVDLGTAVISYTLSTGCTATTTVNVVFAPSVIGGDSTVCVGSVLELGDEVIGGVWSSSASGIASVGTRIGLVTGVSAGTAVISYSLGTGCMVSKRVTVLPLPAVITGTMHVCFGAETTLGDITGGGAWSVSESGVVSAGSGTGIVTGVSAGTVIITYTSAVGCKAMATVTVNPLPAAITGSLAICAGATSILADATGGGIWSAGSGSGVASVGSGTGIITGVAAGTATITYALSSGCAITAVVVVNPLPAGILGTTTICQGDTTILYDSSSGGVWSTSESGVAGAGSGTGVVTGVSAGTAVISYTLGGCLAHKTVLVNPTPAAITGAANGCAGLTSLLTDATAGGTWAVSDTAIATLGTATGILTGRTGGAVTVSYTLSTGCMALTGLTINPTPTPITGPGVVCSGAYITLADATSGGVWSAGSGSGTVSAGSGTGIVTGVSAGTAVVSYAIGGCGATKVVLVDPIPAPIGGPDSVCAAGATIHETESTHSGYWTSIFVTVDTTGLVTSYSAGVGTVSYTIISTGCFVTKSITVLPLPEEIAGAGYVCIGSSITLTDGTTGGVWSAGSGAASAGSGTGIITGVSTGTAIVTYTIPTGCFSTKEISVNPLPQPITGGGSICVGSTTAFADTTPGGIWSAGSGSGVVSAGSGTGIVTGVSAGMALISYSVTNLCGTAVVTKSITVNPLPDAGVISGPGSVCTGAQVTLSETETGGTWSAGSGSGVVSVGSSTGVVTGVSAGADTISYSVTNVCGTATASQTITIKPLPQAGAVTGTDSVCPGDTVTLADTTVGGIWSAGSGSGVVSAGSGTGVITGIAQGADTISYTVSNSCGSAAAIYPFMVRSIAECTSGINAVPGAQQTSLSVYPNPNNGSFHILFSSPVDEVATVTITNMLGEKVVSFTIAANISSDVLLNQSAGVYFITVTSTVGVFTDRITVVR